MQRITFTREEVRETLLVNEASRNNDLVLFSDLLTKRGLPTDLPTLATMTATNMFESISRARRDIQKECPYLQATDAIIAKRRQQENNFKEEYGKWNTKL